VKPLIALALHRPMYRNPHSVAVGGVRPVKHSLRFFVTACSR